MVQHVLVVAFVEAFLPHRGCFCLIVVVFSAVVALVKVPSVQCCHCFCCLCCSYFVVAVVVALVEAVVFILWPIFC